MADMAEMAWLKENLPTGLVPKNMDKFEISLDNENRVSIFLSASDTVIGGSTFCYIKEIILKRKTSSYPKNERDGETVLTLSHEDIALYKDNPFIDETVASGRDYFYQAFLVSDGNAVNRCAENRRMISVGDVPALMSLFRAEPREDLSVALYMDIDNARVNNGVLTNSVMIRKKEDSLPDSPADGELLTKLTSGMLHSYKIDPYIDVNTKLGHFYYRAFPMSESEVFSVGDANVTDTENGAMPSDPLLFNVTSNPDGTVNITFDVLDDIFFGEAKIGSVKRAVVVKNYNRYPLSIEDGGVVVELPKGNLHAYAENAFMDDSGSPAAICYYGLFIESVDGRVNSTGKKKIVMAGHEVYGFRIKKSEADSYERVEYMNACEGYAPIKFDTISGKTSFGSWRDSWILNAVRPVMLRFDGTVAYELDKEDQSKRKDGNPSDVANQQFDGNAMLEIDKIFVKRWEDSEYEYVQFSPYEVDESFIALAHLKNNGETSVDHVYHSLFECAMIDGVLRSIAGKKPSGDMGMEEQIAAAEANGENWNISDFSTEKLLDDILILLGKSTDTQEVYGNGNSDYAHSEENIALTGTFMGSGPFDGISLGPVKTLWIENLWGNIGNRVNGCATDENGTVYVKGYPPYNDVDEDWASLVSVDNLDGYQSGHIMTKFGLIPIADEGSNSTYIPDRIIGGKSAQAVLGGNCVSGLRNAGAFCMDISLPKNRKHWTIGTFLTYK